MHSSGLGSLSSALRSSHSRPLRCCCPSRQRARFRQQLWAELQPVPLANCEMRRFGSPNDGGYLMCGNLLGAVQAAYWYGIGPFDDWGCDVSQSLDVTVHQYDCFMPPPSLCPSGRAVFHNECIGPKTAVIESRVFDSLTRQLSKNGDAGKTFVVKIDIEGAELDSLLATPDSVLQRVDQLAMEIHGADKRFLRMVRKLKRTFHPVHIHFNNQACTVHDTSRSLLRPTRSSSSTSTSPSSIRTCSVPRCRTRWMLPTTRSGTTVKRRSSPRSLRHPLSENPQTKIDRGSNPCAASGWLRFV